MRHHKLNYSLLTNTAATSKIRICLLGFVLVLAVGFWLPISEDEPQRIALADQHHVHLELTVSSAQSGYAQVTSTSDAQVSIREVGEFTVNLTASHTMLSSGQTADIVVMLKDSSGQPIAGELVTFFGSLGVITPDNVVTNEQGKASGSYQAVVESGTAVIQALIGSSNGYAEIQLVGSTESTPASTPALTATPENIPDSGSTPGEELTATPVGHIAPTNSKSIYLPFVSR
ncbi:MAG: Ig-like domain-containing protein [Chloroflexota bacterium]